LNTLVNFQSAQPSKTGQFSVGANTLPPESQHPTLAELGIEKHQSSRWQKLAAVPESRLHRYARFDSAVLVKVSKQNAVLCRGLYKRLFLRTEMSNIFMYSVLRR